ncbi:MAG: hypothetical protein AAB268_13165 [Elusimicrobiota bacterium]
MLSQISLVGLLSSQAVPTLSPLVAEVPTVSEPWRAEAARLIGALVAQPQAVALYQDELRMALGEQGAESLRQTAVRLQAHAVERPELLAQLSNLRSGLDFTDAGAVQKFGSRLTALFENSKSRPEDPSGDAIAASDSAQKQKKMSVSWKLRPVSIGTRNKKYANKRVPAPTGYDDATLIYAPEGLLRDLPKRFRHDGKIDYTPDHYPGAINPSASPQWSIDSFRALTKSAFDAWAEAPDASTRLRLRREFIALGKEFDRAKGGEMDSSTLSYLKTFIREEWNQRRRAIILSEDPEFARMLGLPLGSEQRRDAIRLMARIRWGDATQARGIPDFLEKFKQHGPPNATADIDELYQAQVWAGRLVAVNPTLQISYHQNLSAMSPGSYTYKYYADQAREARTRGEMIVTGGRQSTRRQTRGVCPYNAACNLFAQEIAEARLTSKDILREAYLRNPTFASRPGDGASVVNGLPYEEILGMSQALAARVGAEITTVETGEIIRFMASKKVPVMVTFLSHGRTKGHALLLGNPFVFRSPDGERSVVFETYDSNNPLDVVGYIDSETVAPLMKDRGIALLKAPASVAP